MHLVYPHLTHALIHADLTVLIVGINNRFSKQRSNINIRMYIIFYRHLMLLIVEINFKTEWLPLIPSPK